MCVYVCMYVCMYVLYVFVLLTYAYVEHFVHLCECVCMYVCTHLRVLVYVCVGICESHSIQTS